MRIIYTVIILKRKHHRKVINTYSYDYYKSGIRLIATT